MTIALDFQIDRLRLCLSAIVGRSRSPTTVESVGDTIGSIVSYFETDVAEDG